MTDDYKKGYKAGLEDGKCRFDCRKQKEAYIAGFDDGVYDGAESGTFMCQDYKKKVIDKAYRKWKKLCGSTS